jgi:ABC transporter substrate binding protein
MSNMRRREFVAMLGGAAAAWPVVAWGQQGGRVRLIAFLTGSTESDPNVHTWISALGSGLEPLGWKDGLNVRFERRFAAGDAARAQKLAKEMVQLNPHVIVTTSTPTATALLQETRTIPIVFANLADPLGSGLVSSLAHPWRQCDRIHELRVRDRWEVAGHSAGHRAAHQAHLDHLQSRRGPLFRRFHSIVRSGRAILCGAADRCASQ